jgi:O-antigen/teichoic acid export membrane protein
MTQTARSAIALYAAGVVFDKAFSLVTIPLMAAFVAPGDYGDYELVLSLCAFLLAIASLGIGDTLIRFGSTVPKKDEAKLASELLGCTLVLVVVLGLFVQIFAAVSAKALGIRTDLAAVRWTLLASTVSSLIDLGLVWLRMQDRAQLFFVFTSIRTAAQVGVTWIALIAGQGIEGVLVWNAWVGIGFAVLITALVAWEVGVRVTSRAAYQILSYGLPLVGGGLALFMVTNVNRWFLPGHVSHEDIGLFGLASRLAMAAGLAILPFVTWWFPKRIAALATETGRAESERMWGYAFIVIVISGMAVVLAGPVAIKLVLPSSFVGASAYLPGATLAICIAQVALITNVGIMARSNGRVAFAIDGVGAIVALATLWLLVPRWGVGGAIAATVLAQASRCLLSYIYGRDYAPLTLPLGGSGLVAVLACITVWVAPNEDIVILRIIWSAAAIAVVLWSAHVLQVASIPRRALLALGRPFGVVGRSNI